MKCPICNDDLKLENCVNTECGHSFCNTCFWKWTKEHNTCPLCRSSILANSEELKEQMYIRKMLEQRSELSGQIQYFEKKHSTLKEQIQQLESHLSNIYPTKSKQKKSNASSVLICPRCSDVASKRCCSTDGNFYCRNCCSGCSYSKHPRTMNLGIYEING
tara:strand:- start:285 stop:767 length:483 start_codon:yes stop_codon:yes gene_type:complete